MLLVVTVFVVEQVYPHHDEPRLIGSPGVLKTALRWVGVVNGVGIDRDAAFQINPVAQPDYAANDREPARLNWLSLVNVSLTPVVPVDVTPNLLLILAILAAPETGPVTPPPSWTGC
jgi:hypothetical protein